MSRQGTSKYGYSDGVAPLPKFEYKQSAWCFVCKTSHRWNELCAPRRKHHAREVTAEEAERE